MLREGVASFLLIVGMLFTKSDGINTDHVVD